ncbi:beta-propeller fold lactonase family protein [Marinomonas lutimaris]|uniref:beta-propeller fold lactonase family protein n=1 Tax=Marinomonas lutimaris TaxID=2846746 RepID=UPI001CA5EC58|nr:putative Ig domain-containing protein [Marinomonas lutimaris]
MMFDAEGAVEAADTLSAVSAAETDLSASNAVDARGEVPTIEGDINIYYDSKADLQGSEYSLNGVESMALSSDGKYAYSVYSGGGDSAAIGVFSVDESGQLTLVHTYYNYSEEYTESSGLIRTMDIEGIAGATHVLLSDDQQSVYVYGETDNSIVTFTRNADTGALGFQSKADLSNFGIDNDSVYVEDIIMSNGHFYIAAGDSIVVLDAGEDGNFTEVGAYTNGQDGVSGLEGVRRLALSDDGEYLIAGENSALTLFNVNDDGTLQFVSSVDSGIEESFTIQSIVVAKDGKAVYALNSYSESESEILVMTLSDDGILAFNNRYALSAGAQSIVVSDNGAGVFVLGSNADVFSYDETNQSLTKVDTLSGGFGGDLGGEFGESSKSYLSADGRKVFVLNTQFSRESILTYDLAVNKPSHVEGDGSVLLLPSGRIGDSELDELDDYQGASFNVVRESGGLEEDSYGFINGNGLTLEDGKILQNGVEIATFVVFDNSLMVNFTSATNHETAQNVLRQISYANTSNDPLANGASPTFVIMVDDGDGNQTSLDVIVNLIDVNDPSILTTTPAQIIYPTGSDYTPLFSGTSIDTVEKGQLIGQVVLNITGASSFDVLKIGDSKLILSTTSGPSTISSGLSYMVTKSGDTTTVTLYLQQSATEAASLIDSISYKYEGKEIVDQRTVALSVVEPWDGSSSLTTTYEDEAVITFEQGQNSAPVLSGDTGNISYIEGSPAFSVFPDANLPVDEQMDAYNNGLGSYHRAVMTVSIDDASPGDVLSFSDGNNLTLSKGTEILKDGVIIGTVSVSDGELTVTFTENNGATPTTEDVKNILNQIQYKSTSDSPVATLTITATMTNHLGLTSAGLSTQVDIIAVNDAPLVRDALEVSADDIGLIANLDSIEGLENVAASTVSGDGTIFYVADSKGNIAVFNRDADTGEWVYQITLPSIEGLESVDKLVTTADGKSLYALGHYEAISWNVPVDRGVIAVFSLNGSSELTETQRVIEGDDFSINSITDLVLSDDGENAYYLYDNGLGVMSRDTSTGILTSEVIIANSTTPLWQPTALTVSDHYVFVTSNYNDASVIVVDRANNELAWISNGYIDSFAQTAKLDSLSHIAVTDDGTYIYVVNGSSIYTYAYNTADKSLSVVNTEDNLIVENLTDMVVSNNGRELLVSTSEGTLNRYVIGYDGQLTLISTVTQAVSDGKEINVSKDGYIYLQGNSVAIFEPLSRQVTAYEIGFEAVALAPTTAIYDAEFAALDNYKGLTLSIQSTSPSADDIFDILSGSGFSIQGENLFFNDALVGTFTAENGVLTVAITGDLTQIQVNTLVQNVSYENPNLTEAITQIFTISANDGEINSVEFQSELNVVRNSIPEATGGYVIPSVMETAPTSIVLPEGLFVDAGGEPLTWSVTGLPTGLTFDPLTRTILGRASESGAFSLTFTATDPRLQSASLELDLVVERLPLTDQSSNENDALISSLANREPSFGPDIGDTLLQGDIGRFPSTAFPSAPDFGLSEANNQRITTLSSENGDVSRLSEISSPLPIEAYRFVSLTWLGGDRQVAFSLLDNVLSVEEKTILAVTLADGVSLPDGVEFDADTGELTINKTVLEATDQIELQILVVDEQGNASIVPVEVTLQAAQQASAVPFAQQVKNAGLMSLSDDSQALLAELSVN